MPTISVIITTFNGSKNINNTLRAILQQEGINSLFELDIIKLSTIVRLTIRSKSLNEYPIRIFSTETNSGVRIKDNMVLLMLRVITCAL